jgi:hypothetical protein
MNLAFVVVLIQCYPDIPFACPITHKFVVFFKYVLEMLCMSFANIFHAKVINNQCELYWSCDVFPKTRYQLALLVSMFVETFFEEFVGQYSCLWDAVHAMLGSDVDAAVFGGFLSELVFVDDLIRDIT